jgi:hypothetical protein
MILTFFGKKNKATPKPEKVCKMDSNNHLPMRAFLLLQSLYNVLI